MARVGPAPPMAAVRVDSDGSLGAHSLGKKDDDGGLATIVPESGDSGWLFFARNRFDGNAASAVADPSGGIVFIAGPDCYGNDGCNVTYCSRKASVCFTTFGRIAGDGSGTFLQPRRTSLHSAVIAAAKGRNDDATSTTQFSGRAADAHDAVVKYGTVRTPSKKRAPARQRARV